MRTRARARAREDTVYTEKAMLEKDLEYKLRNEIQGLGGECPKWVSPGCTGVPDRIVLMQDGRIAFVEMKAPGKKERPRQKVVQQRLRGLGFKVFSSVDSKARIDEVVEWAKGGDGK